MSRPRQSIYDRRLVILSEGAFGVIDAKTAASIIRYAPDNVLAVIDSTRAGKDVADFLGHGHGIPIVATLEETLSQKPDTLLIGIAPPGGGLPPSWRATLKSALACGMDIISGLHEFLEDDAELVELARQYDADLWDVRRPPDGLGITTPHAQVDAHVVLTVGTDCKVGKKITAIELDRAARRSGLNSRFLATGQTGVMITGEGICVDAVVADFIAGAAQQMVLSSAAAYDWLFVEGQGSLFHPAYSGVTLGLLHGSQPDAMILCHEVDCPTVKRYPVPIPPLREVVERYEFAAAWIKPSPVVGIALNCYRRTPDEALELITRLEKETGLPTTDVVRFGAEKLIQALQRQSEKGKTSTTATQRPGDFTENGIP